MKSWGLNKMTPLFWLLAFIYHRFSFAAIPLLDSHSLFPSPFFLLRGGGRRREVPKMARLLRERGSPGHSRRDSSGNSLRLSLSQPATSASAVEFLPSPFGELGCNFSDAELRETAYEIFVAASRTSSGKPLAFIPQSEKAAALSATPPSAERSPSPSMQRSLTSTAASKMKKALGLKPSRKSPGKDSSPSRAAKRPATAGELVRVQMGVSEPTDSRIRRGLLRISASQVSCDLGFRDGICSHPSSPNSFLVL